MIRRFIKVSITFISSHGGGFTTFRWTPTANGPTELPNL